MELTSEVLLDESGLRVVAQNDGGAAGLFDRPNVRVGVERWDSARLESVEGSVLITIPPHAAAMPELHVASAVATVTDERLASADTLVAFIRGYRIDTDLYEVAPDFAERIPYDPALGYTSQGLGIQLGAPAVEGDDIRFAVQARNSLGLSDRADMNEAMSEATTWVRVDYLLVGAFGRSHGARAAAEYTLSYATFGQNTVHEHADPSAQEATVTGEPGLPNGLLGLTGFDFWLNVPGRIDPSCVEVHAMDGIASGPGRYVTELSVRLWDPQYEPGSGRATAKVDMMLSNSSNFTEVGNVCLGLRGEVGLLQFGGAARSSSFETDTVELPLSRGLPHTFDALFDEL